MVADIHDQLTGTALIKIIAHRRAVGGRNQVSRFQIPDHLIPVEQRVGKIAGHAGKSGRIAVNTGAAEPRNRNFAFSKRNFRAAAFHLQGKPGDQTELGLSRSDGVVLLEFPIDLLEVRDDADL